MLTPSPKLYEGFRGPCFFFSLMINLREEFMCSGVTQASLWKNYWSLLVSHTLLNFSQSQSHYLSRDSYKDELR